MQHDVADLDRHAFPALHRALVGARHIGADLERQAVGAEEAEAITAARRIKLARLVDDPAAGVLDLAMQRIDILAAVCGQRDHLDAIGAGVVQPHDMVLVMPVRLEPRHAAACGNLDQAPVVRIELPLRGKVRHPIADIADLGNSGVHGQFL